MNFCTIGRQGWYEFWFFLCIMEGRSDFESTKFIIILGQHHILSFNKTFSKCNKLQVILPLYKYLPSSTTWEIHFSLEYIVLGPALFEYQLACRYISKCREERGRVVIMASISPDRYLMKWVCSTGCSSSVKVSLKVERSIRSRTTKGKMTERVEQMCWRQSDSHSLSWIGLWWWAA